MLVPLLLKKKSPYCASIVKHWLPKQLQMHPCLMLQVNFHTVSTEIRLHVDRVTTIMPSNKKKFKLKKYGKKKSKLFHNEYIFLHWKLKEIIYPVKFKNFFKSPMTKKKNCGRYFRTSINFAVRADVCACSRIAP